MQLAEQKKKNNVIEYLLFVYQMEDLMRSCNLNINTVVARFIEPHIQDQDLANDYKRWYNSIIEDLKSFNREKQGHISEVYEIQMELFYLHNSLLTVTPSESYIALYAETQPFINEFRDKTPMQFNDVDLCIHALYMKLLLKMQGKPISETTENAFEMMKNLLVQLAKAYHKMKSGDVAFHLN
jgi:hypothetical protein